MVTYQQAKAAFEAGGKLYEEGSMLIVTRVLRPDEDGHVLWVTDAEGLGDMGVLLYPDGQVEKRAPQVVDSSALP